ncbi:MAG: hypothetical protein ABI682_15065 [Acidobacteriota bacterium]
MPFEAPVDFERAVDLDRDFALVFDPVLDPAFFPPDLAFDRVFDPLDFFAPDLGVAITFLLAYESALMHTKAYQTANHR